MSLAWRRSPGLQFAAVVLALAALAAILYLPQALDGGFLSDAWANRAAWVFNPGSGFFGKVSQLASLPNIAPRPLQAVYLALLNTVFGSNASAWLTWQLLTNVAMCAVLYLLLRKLGFKAFDAGTMAALVLAFPAASSTRFWLATIWAPAALGMVCLGFLLALYAFEARTTRGKLALHGLSLLLFVASLLLYEVALLVVLAGVLLYLLRAPWREALARWAVDCAVLITLTLTITLGSSNGHEETTVGIWEHGRTIFDQAVTLGTTVVVPFTSQWYVIVLALAVPTVSLLVWRRSDPGDPVRAVLQRWLLTMAAGALIVTLGYAIFAPGTDYYAPLNPGIGNRVNVVPSFGWVLMLYAAAMLCATLALRRLPRWRNWVSAAATLACALVAISWVGSISDYSGYFTRASEEDRRVLATMQRVLPDPPPYSAIWTFGQPVEIVPFVPVFANTWDMLSSVRLTYDDPTLASLVAFPETNFECAAEALLPAGSYSENGAPNPQLASPYGKTYFVNTTTGEVAEINSRRQCSEALQRFPEAPPYPPPVR